MPSGFSVYSKLINNTGERLVNDPANTTTVHGDWNGVPSVIAPGVTGSFSLEGRSGALYGSEGSFVFYIVGGDNQRLSRLSSYQTDPIQVANEVRLDALTPKALYLATFRASTVSENGPWTDGTVDPAGRPFWVEYNVRYQPKRFHFILKHISATSFHFVRNSRRKLVYGTHDLWDSASPNQWNDGQNGSFQPNVFAYDFTSPVPTNSAITVTVRPVDLELEGAEAVVVGYINNKRVFLSSFFTLKVGTDQKVTTRIISPNTSKDPFAWNDNVTWGVELRYSTQPVDPYPNTPYITRLELYWISSSFHIAFKNEIPIGFLRDVLKRSPRTIQADSGTSVGKVPAAVTVRTSGYYSYVTNAVFAEFSKKYDTISGAAQFGIGAWGGNFLQAYYRAADETGEPGTLFRFVNCMDQAAMLELSCSFWKDPGEPTPTSWLVQQPFGYINTTHLVGVTQADFSGPLINVNNPFFGTDRSRALLPINDTTRMPFGCHVYVGYSKPFDRQSDGVFDACSGPHIGTENAQAYVTAAIDTQTNLYNINNTHPGTVANIQQGSGVTGIDNHHPFLRPGPGSSFDLAPARALLNRIAPMPAARNVTYVDWANLPSWLTSVLGNTWTVSFGSLTASDGIADAFWHLSDSANRTQPVRVHATTMSVAGTNGALDLAASVQAVRDHVTAIIASCDRDPESVWASGTFNDFGDYSVQYAANLAAGRVIVAAANAVVDIAGRASTVALSDIARRLLTRTVRRGTPSLAFPVLTYRGTGDEVAVRGLQTPFSVSFSAVGQLSAAGATCEDDGVVFDDSVITEVAGGNSTVDFAFISRELGVHAIRVHCAHIMTMVCATRTLRVKVTA